jgi:hypothetical protein
MKEEVNEKRKIMQLSSLEFYFVINVFISQS